MEIPRRMASMTFVHCTEFEDLDLQGLFYFQFDFQRLLYVVQDLKTLKEGTKQQLRATYAAVRGGTTPGDAAITAAGEAGSALPKDAMRVLGSDGPLRVRYLSGYDYYCYSDSFYCSYS